MHKSTFAKARKTSRELLSAAFLRLDADHSSDWPPELFRWSHGKLHVRIKEDRLAGLVGFAFFVDLEDRELQLLPVVQDLERILPLSQFDLSFVDGSADLIRRIARKVSSPIIRTFFGRCVTLAATRQDDPEAVRCSVFLILRISSFDSTVFQCSSSELDDVIRTALRSDSEEIQRVAVKLGIKKAACDPSATEYVSTHITSAIFLLQESEVNPRVATGMLLLLSAFIKRNLAVCARPSSSRRLSSTP
jgi:hypothetical protein